MTPTTGRPTRVVKFGGASLEDPDAIAAYVRSYGPARYGVVVVASARAGVTDNLEGLLTRPTDAPSHRRTLHRIASRYPGLSMDRGSPWNELTRRVRRGERLGRFPPASADAIRAIGERLSVRWLTGVLRERGIAAEPVDADVLGLCVRIGAGVPTLDLRRSRASVRRGVNRCLARGTVPVVTGYLARSGAHGVAVLGRGGSDYSATALAAVLGARSVDLLKPEYQLRSADPELVPGTVPVPGISYEVAEELAQLGSRILHPLAIEPARAASVEVRLIGGASPRRTTIIGPGGSRERARIVTISGPLRRIRVSAPGGRHRAGALAWVTDRLARRGIPIFGVFTDARHVALLVAEAHGRDVRSAIASGGAERPPVRIDPGRVVVVAVVGEGLLKDLDRTPPTVLRTARELAGGARSWACVVPAGRAIGTARALHRAFVTASARAARRRSS